MSGSGHLPMAGGAEFDLIRRLVARWGATAQGIGDDAAVLPPLDAGSARVVSTDASVEEFHFRERWLAASLITPREIGARAALAALSDLAAMGATARAALLSLVVPPHWEPRLDDFADGVGWAVRDAGAHIMGGNVARGATFSATLTVIGDAPRVVSRRGAAAGEVVVITGVLGGPGRALALLEAGERPPEPFRTRFVAPASRLRAAAALAAAGATAMLDVSDGLLGDAGHLAAASGVALELESAPLPRLAGVTLAEALRSGEEYELLATLPVSRVRAAQEALRALGVPLTAIGRVAPDTGPRRVRIVGDERADAQLSEAELGGRVEFTPGHDHLSR